MAEDIKEKILKARQGAVSKAGNDWENYVEDFLKGSFEILKDESANLKDTIEDLVVLKMGKRHEIERVKKQFNDYSYCVATNEEDPDYLNSAPKWIDKHCTGGDAEMGEPVGCPKCHAWGVHNFELVG